MNDGAQSSGFSYFPAIAPPAPVRLTVLSEHACSYLPNRQARMRALWTERMDPEVYRRFMDCGFRRSGKLVYQPVCAGCRACQTLRVPVAAFRASKSQRRCMRRNSDLQVTSSGPSPSAEKFELYQRYAREWHQSSSPPSYEEFVSFLYESPVQSLEFSYRDAPGRLLAVGICDISRTSLSSVYFYFDPASSGRGLGTFGALREIEAAKGQGIAYYYLGYWIDACRCMAYKSSFNPCEVLGPDGQWKPPNFTAEADRRYELNQMCQSDDSLGE